MKNEILNLLAANGISNDLRFPVWLYQIENITIKNKRFLKAYLFNRQFDDSQTNRIHFIHEGKEYICESFSIVNKYNDLNVFECFFEIAPEDQSSELKIIKEMPY